MSVRDLTNNFNELLENNIDCDNTHEFELYYCDILSYYKLRSCEIEHNREMYEECIHVINCFIEKINNGDIFCMEEIFNSIKTVNNNEDFNQIFDIELVHTPSVNNSKIILFFLEQLKISMEFNKNINECNEHDLETAFDKIIKAIVYFCFKYDRNDDAIIFEEIITLTLHLFLNFHLECSQYSVCETFSCVTEIMQLYIYNKYITIINSDAKYFFENNEIKLNLKNPITKQKYFDEENPSLVDMINMHWHNYCIRFFPPNWHNSLETCSVTKHGRDVFYKKIQTVIDNMDRELLNNNIVL